MEPNRPRDPLLVEARESKDASRAGTLDLPHGESACPVTADQWQRIASALVLTPRELEIVSALFLGLDEKQIAVRLAISRFTVHTHLGRLYRKLGVDSARGVLLRVFRELLPPQG